MIKIPNEKNKVWQQVNEGDSLGNINISQNLDLINDKPRIKISPRFMFTSNQGQDPDLKTPFAFKKLDFGTDNTWYMGAGAYIFKGGVNPTDQFEKDMASGTPNMETSGTPDMELYVDNTTVSIDFRLYAAAGSLDVLDVTGANWTTVTSLSGTGGAPLINYAGKLYFKNDFCSMGSMNVDQSTNKPSGEPSTVQYALRLMNGHSINCGRANSSAIWLGTQAPDGFDAKMVKWDGSTPDPSSVYTIPAKAILAVFIGIDDQPYCIDSNLTIWGFNGGTFVKKERFPMKSNKRLFDSTATAPVNRSVHYNGVIVLPNGDILILANPRYADGTSEIKAPAGVWVYNKENGLHHSGSMSLLEYGSGNNFDYAQTKLGGVGAMSRADSISSSTDGGIFAGAAFDRSATGTEIAAVFISNLFDTEIKVGTYTSPWIYSSEVKDNFSNVIARFKEFATEGDKIVFKYRRKESAEQEVAFTWIDSQSFIVTDSVTNFAKGDEVTILTGYVGGLVAHITSITVTDPGTVITIDETLPFETTGEVGLARFEKWIKSASYDKFTDDFFKFPMPKISSSKTQIKFWVRVTGDWFLQDMELINSTNQTTKLK